MKKSQCCGAVVWRFGNRRRKCGLCKKTWRIFSCRKGRKQIRQRPRFSYRVLTENRSLRKFSENVNINREKIRKRFHSSLNVILKKNFSPEKYLPNKEKLLAVTDALHFHSEGKDALIIIILLRPVKSDKAAVASIEILFGGETEENWKLAFENLSENLKKRIIALISDDSLGLVRYAKSKNWIIQICHFHLKSRFVRFLGKKKRIRFRNERRLAYSLVTQVASEMNNKRLGFLIREIKRLSKSNRLPKYLKIHLRGFLRNWRDYRTYLKYPKFNLPNTSNSAEAMIKIIRETLQQKRGFKTTKSLKRWLKAIQILHPIITCKRANHTPN